jgi:hypothetical protein
VTDQQMAELLLWDFALRAQQDEERAYQKARKFITASERMETAYQEQRILEDRRRAS